MAHMIIPLECLSLRLSVQGLGLPKPAKKIENPQSGSLDFLKDPGGPEPLH